MQNLTTNLGFTLRTFVTIVLLSAFTSEAGAENAAQHLLSSIREVTGVPGMSAAVSLDGEVIWTGTVGYRNHSKSLPVNAETKFRIASVSKLVTAALVLNAAENAILDLDTDIRTFVPEWPNHNGAVITLRHLAAHTSGISHYGAGDQYNSAIQYENLSDSITIFADKPLLARPGQEYSYSSYGYALMGASLESTTAKSFSENLQTVIAVPFGLSNTEAENISALPENTTDLFLHNGTPAPRNDQAHVIGATGILSTPSDLIRFANAYSKGHIISAKNVSMSWEPTLLNNGEPVETARFQIGFGWRIGLNWNGDQVFHHAGTTPGARSILSINPERNTTVAFLSNAQWVSRIETTAELLAAAATEGLHSAYDTCDVGTWSIAGKFIEDTADPPAGNNESGQIIVIYSDGVCSGRLVPTDALARWLRKRGSKTAYLPLTLVSVEKTGARVFAAATPWGAFPLRISKNTDSLVISGDFAGRVINLSATNIMQ